MSQKTENRAGQTGFVYIVECADGTLYTGWTTDVRRRVETHNRGQGARYTRARRPVSLVYFEQIEGKGNGLRREAAIKKLKREEKRSLIASDRNLLNTLEDSGVDDAFASQKGIALHPSDNSEG